MDLDLDNLDKNNWENNSNEELKKEENKQKISDEKTDILNDIKNNSTVELESNTLEDIIDEKISEKNIPENEETKEEQKEVKEIEEKENTPNEIKTEEVNIIKETAPEEKIIFDINIDSLEYLIKYLISKQYDFFTLEPTDSEVKVSFRKDNKEEEVKYIKFPIYTNILLRAKAITKLKIEDTVNSQEWKSEINLDKTIYKILSKTAPSNTGERLFFKLVKTEKKWAP